MCMPFFVQLKTIRTARLMLEPLVEDHAGELFAGLRDPELYDFIEEPRPRTVEALRQRYRRLATRWSPDRRELWLNWALWSAATRRYVGWIQATVHYGLEADVAYVLFRDAWGQGFAREAMAALIEHLRDEWAVEVVRATVDARNRRSISLLQALGFFPTGVRRPNAAHAVDLEFHRPTASSDETRAPRAAGPDE